MTSAAGLKAQAKYDRTNTRQIALKMNLKHDADILGKLEATDNIQGYIKKLIREDMRGNCDIIALDNLKYLILPTAKKYNFTKAYVFGSYARGEADGNSDIDVLVDSDGINNLSDYNNAVRDLEASTGKKIDLVMNRAVQRDDSRSGRRFRENIERDKVLIYERN